MEKDRDILIETIVELIPDELEDDEAIIFSYSKGTSVRTTHVGNVAQLGMAGLSACKNTLKRIGMKKEDALELLAEAWDAAKEEIGEGK